MSCYDSGITTQELSRNSLLIAIVFITQYMENSNGHRNLVVMLPTRNFLATFLPLLMWDSVLGELQNLFDSLAEDNS